MRAMPQASGRWGLVGLVAACLWLLACVPALAQRVEGDRAAATGAYEAEVYRGALLAIPRGQAEASKALGMSARQTLRHVLLPQALRLALPAMTNDFVSLLKDSSLVSVITVIELTKRMTIAAVDLHGWLVPGRHSAPAASRTLPGISGRLLPSGTPAPDRARAASAFRPHTDRQIRQNAHWRQAIATSCWTGGARRLSWLSDRPAFGSIQGSRFIQRGHDDAGCREA